MLQPWDVLRARNELFRRLPGLRFEVEEIVVEGGPWSTRMARYATKCDGKLIYRGVQFTRIAWGKLVEERVLPDPKALPLALG
jgi:hypothetical protein